jgi:hypothetical protein
MLSFCHACTYGSTYDIEGGAISGRLYLTAQLQLAPCLLQVVHTCGTKMRLSTWLQPGAAALLTWGKTTMTYIRHTVKCAIKMPDTVLAFLSPTVNEVQHLETILYLSPWIDHLHFRYLLSHVLAAYLSLAIAATLKLRKSILPLLPNSPFLLQQTHLSRCLNQRMHNFLPLHA